jgi:hypothetical protein
MFAVPVTRELRAIGVLLGGAGHARLLTLPARPLAALLKSSPSSPRCVAWESESRAAGVSSC